MREVGSTTRSTPTTTTSFTNARQHYCADTAFVERRRKIVCPQFQVPVGTGIIEAGANRNLVARNHIYDNWRLRHRS